MAMVALNAERTKVVERGSLEARWLVNEEDVAECIRHAALQPKMQALMRQQAEARLEDEKRSAVLKREVEAYRAARRAGLTGPADPRAPF